MNRLIIALAALATVACTEQAQPTQPDTNAVVDAIMSRRSIRAYTDQPVEREKLQKIADCGINAPSALNQQPWQIRIVTDKAFIDSTSANFAAANPERTQHLLSTEKQHKNMYRNATALICVAGPADGSGDLDLGLLGQNMMLAAHSMGLGTCCLGTGVAILANTEANAPFLQKLNFPSDYKLTYVLAVGYPDETPEQKPRDTTKIKFID